METVTHLIKDLRKIRMKNKIMLPGYGTFPKVIISYNNIPYDHTSDFTLHFL